MEQLDSEVPLPHAVPKIGIIYNLKKGILSKASDIEAEYDSIDTVNAIKAALEKYGLDTVLLEAEPTLPEKLRESGIDLAFNIAEGSSGRGREAQIPALLSMLGIPFTGSDETTLCIALDKALTKRLLSTYRVRTPKYALLRRGEPLSVSGMKYPVIVKPDAEGSSKGISDVSIVESAAELRALAKRNIELYGGDMLAEEYIEGREFTVGVLGNGAETRIFTPMEIVFQRETQGSYHVYSYNVKQEYKKYVRYECPPALGEDTLREMTDTALKIYKALACRDFARMDFRVDRDGKVYFIEINPLPGLAPGYSDYPMLAEFCGVDYDSLVCGVLCAAAERYGLDIEGRRRHDEH